MSNSEHRVVVLVGRLGVGVEALLDVISRLGFAIIDADDLAHRLIQRGTPAFNQISGRAGQQFLDPDGQLDLFQLRQHARSDAVLARDLRSITGPRVLEELSRLVRKVPGPVVFVRTRTPDAYFTLQLADRIWSVTAEEVSQIDNLVREQGWTHELAQRFIRSQSAVADRAVPPDLIVRTDVSEAELFRTVISGLAGLGIEAFPIQQAATAEVPAPSSELQPVEPEPEPPAATAYAPEEPTVCSGAASGSDTIPPAATRTLGSVEIRLLARLILGSLLILLAIAFFTAWGLLLAQYGREGLPVQPLASVWEAVTAVVNYITAHPSTYVWARQQVPWVQLVEQTLGRSAGLLILSMCAATILGFPLGVIAARARHRSVSAITVVISILGTSTPSFLLGMILWVVNIWVHRASGLQGLPSTGFGWDAHVIMPMLVLAMRPLAQIAQITYVTLREALPQDYVRTAMSKGLAWRSILTRHLLRNLLIPVLNTIGSSLRFSLSSLPIVEIFFRWPGIGSTLLDAIQAGNSILVMDLTLSLGLFFLFVNLLLEFLFPLIDPRLRSTASGETQETPQSLLGFARELGGLLAAWFAELRAIFRPPPGALPPLAAGVAGHLAGPEQMVPRSKAIWGSLLRNPILIVSVILVAGLGTLALFGQNFTAASPYELHGFMSINGNYAAPPFAPSSVFPWGSDQLGRDIQALVLAGARRTLTLAFFGMLARVLVGSILGLLAGWQRGGWFDRLVSGAIGAWAAFPATVFAMIIVEALGIQQGMWVFVVAISLVGWGEVAQFVRGQVMTLKAQPFIESARAVGARADQMLVRHILPNLVNPLVVLGALEIGGILMLLAELGFLNVFMGGGFRLMIGESGSMAPVIAAYSDVPEWSALIASVRDQWRSRPWMALYPGAAIFLAIVSFNLFGEGLRRFLEDSSISLGRMLNRFSLVAVIGVEVAVSLVLASSAPLNTYRAEGLKFNQAQVVEDIRVLSSPELQGRETGTAGADLAALYIAQRMAQIGIFPAGEHYGYFQRTLQPRRHMLGTPTLSLLDDSGGTIQEFNYRQDFVEMARLPQSHGEAVGRVTGVAFGSSPETDTDGQLDLTLSGADDHIIIIRLADLPKVRFRSIKAVLVIADSPENLQRRELYPYRLAPREDERPVLQITPEVADVLLRSAGGSLQELDSARSNLAPGQLHITPEGLTARVSVPAGEAEENLNEAYLNVIGVIPGQGHFMGTEDRIIMVSAYYDGVGTDPNGTVFPGANDNASGVAAMLELARLLKTSAYQPDKTVIFVAWIGGERQEGLSTADILNARPGANEMTVEAVLELSGVGAGSGNAVAIGNDSSYRLVQLYQAAAGRYGVRTTTRGRGPHYDLPAPRILGGREALTLSLSWDGSDGLAHLPEDTIAQIDPSKLLQVGRSAYLTLLVLARETEY